MVETLPASNTKDDTNKQIQCVHSTLLIQNF